MFRKQVSGDDLRDFLKLNAPLGVVKYGFLQHDRAGGAALGEDDGPGGEGFEGEAVGRRLR
jgi:hypothetical protein